MSKDDSLRDLIDRVERAESDDHELMWEAFRAIHGPIRAGEHYALAGER